ncbi:MAG: hypothetical protein C0494_01025 [Sphingobium sp.]|nr:hypothetical protein [Sphingobium sp.]
MTVEEQMGRITPDIARETIVSAVINGAIGALFFFIIFGSADHIAVGEWHYAVDFLPQSAAVALMACLVPGLIARRAQLTGRLGIRSGSPATIQWLLRAAFLSILSALMLGAAIAFLWLVSDVATLHWRHALGIKIIYGAALGAWVTWRVLRRMVGGAPLI